MAKAIDGTAGIPGRCPCNGGVPWLKNSILRRVRGELDPKTALIGFCGAPWTVATYMVAGQGTPDQAAARLMAYRHPDAFAKIIDALVENSIQYLLSLIHI